MIWAVYHFHIPLQTIGICRANIIILICIYCLQILTVIHRKYKKYKINSKYLKTTRAVTWQVSLIIFMLNTFSLFIMIDTVGCLHPSCAETKPYHFSLFPWFVQTGVFMVWRHFVSNTTDYWYGHKKCHNFIHILQCSVSKSHFLLSPCQVLTEFMHMVFYREVGLSWVQSITTIWKRLTPDFTQNHDKICHS